MEVKALAVHIKREFTFDYVYCADNTIKCIAVLDSQ